jgi:hypothetical protein
MNIFLQRRATYKIAFNFELQMTASKTFCMDGAAGLPIPAIAMAISLRVVTNCFSFLEMIFFVPFPAEITYLLGQPGSPTSFWDRDLHVWLAN